MAILGEKGQTNPAMPSWASYGVPNIAGSEFEADCERAEVDFMQRGISPERALSESVGWKYEIQGSGEWAEREPCFLRRCLDAMARWRLFAGVGLHCMGMLVIVCSRGIVRTVVDTRGILRAQLRSAR